MTRIVRLVLFTFISILFGQFVCANSLKKDIIYTSVGSFLHATPADKNSAPFYSESISISTGQKIIGFSVDVLESEVSPHQNYKVSGDLQLAYNFVSARNQRFIQYSFCPYFEENGKTRRVLKFAINYKLESVTAKPAYRKTKSSNTVMSGGEWVRIKTTESGVYKLTGKQLKDAGVSSINSIKVYGDNGSVLSLENSEVGIPEFLELPIEINNGNDGSFDNSDYILFYAQSPHTIFYSEENSRYEHKNNPYTDENYFLVNVNNGNGKTIGYADYSNQAVTLSLNYYDNVQIYEENDTNLVRSGRFMFQSAGSRSYDFSFKNQLSSRQSTLTARVVSNASSASSFSLIAGGKTIGSADIRAGEHVAVVNDFSFTTSADEFAVQLIKNSASSGFWLDYLLLDVPSSMELAAGQLLVRNKESIGETASYNVSSSNNTVWDVTDVHNVKKLKVSGGKFIAPGDVLRTFAVFDGSAYKSPEIIEKVTYQNLRSAATTELIIITNEAFLSQAKRLADFHTKTDGISSAVYIQQQVFNEFSYGRPDVAAVRNFMRSQYEKDGKLRYLLMFGDGTYKNGELYGDKNYLITYQSYESLGESAFVSDDFFALLDTGEGEVDRVLEGAMDIGVGRLPVTSESQAAAMVNKIIHYSTSPSTRGKWRNNMAFIADDGDGNIHMQQSENLTDLVEELHPEVLVDKIFADAFKKSAGAGGGRYPEMTKQIFQSVKKGMLVLNYTGHGNPVQFGVERFLSISDINTWDNYENLPLVVTASCEISRYDDPVRPSLGENLLNLTDGGAIGLMTTTRLVYSTPNYYLNRQILQHLYGYTESGEPNRLGDIIRQSKIGVGKDIFQNKRNFALLGDPAMCVAVPRYDVITDSINGVALAEWNDTIKSLSEMRVSGHIQSADGSMLSSYNGIVYPTVMDKERDMSTLDNNGEGAFDYDEFVNVLFKGKATVKNGYFSFNFLVPKDISYKYGTGKVSYYADNGTTDASGADTSFVVGGASGLGYDDSEGPQLGIYMNDTTFVFGGTTNESPELIVRVYDQSGVNLTGNAIGHDLSAVLDNDVASTIVLNEFYEADLDSYKSGTVNYQLSELDEGKHSVRVKVWDAVNNSSEDFLEFYVTSSEETALKHVLNYPNPFTTRTSFFFEHNQAGEELDIQIQIFTVSGKLVKNFQIHEIASGFRSAPIEWDGLDEYGDRLGRGVYIYRVCVRSQQGGDAEAYQKLVLLR